MNEATHRVASFAFGVTPECSADFSPQFTAARIISHAAWDNATRANPTPLGGTRSGVDMALTEPEKASGGNHPLRPPGRSLLPPCRTTRAPGRWAATPERILLARVRPGAISVRWQLAPGRWRRARGRQWVTHNRWSVAPGR